MSSGGTNQLIAPLTYWLSGALAIVALAASAGSFFISGIFARDNAALGGCAQGTALVILAVAVPVLVISMFLTARGSLRARVLWMGAVLYILYNSVYFAFSASFNRLFLVYVLMLSLALWAFLALVKALDLAAFGAAFAPKTWVKAVLTVFLLLPILIFIPLDFMPALTGTLTDSIPVGVADTQLPTNHFSVIDLAIWTPLFALAAVLLWQRKPLGSALTGIMLTFYTLELFGIGIDQHFGGLADPTSPLASAAAMPMFVALAVVWLGSLTLYLWNLRQSRDEVKP